MLVRVKQLEVCDRGMFGDVVVTCQTAPNIPIPQPKPFVPPAERYAMVGLSGNGDRWENERRRASVLVDELLMDIYSKIGAGLTDYNSATSSKSSKECRLDEKSLWEKDVSELRLLLTDLRTRLEREGRGSLLRHLKRRDALRRQREARCDLITHRLRQLAPETDDMRFSVDPAPGESGFSQWAAAMRMVAQLPGGIPPEFRRKLWLQLADRFLASKRVDWPAVERSCFSEWSHPADAELGVQIVKDLHRTGCSLFCGVDGQENQALLKRVLLAYARWNKAVGYCQGFNMLAALLLQVTEKNESDALKLMIYLIEGVLPDSYFADSLRGLSVDMAVFRELLKKKSPRLAGHLETLQCAAKDGTTSYEPPLTNVFTMQWFLTLFCNCLPQPTVLRVWDLIFLDGNEILLRTALAIWHALEERILSVRSADEFYCIMGVLTRELLEFGLVEPNSLIKAIVAIGPLTELKGLRDRYLYNINPWGSAITSQTLGDGDGKQLKLYPKERLMLDIGALKKQYAKLKQRQRQAHIIFSAAVSRQPPPSTPVAMNHLLLGKSALLPARRLGPPKGSVPPARQQQKDSERSPSSSSSSDTELCDDPEEESSQEDLADDNRDATLMNTDNTRENSATDVFDSKVFDNNELVDSANNEYASDIFDTASTSDYGRELSRDDLDFEKFLEDRVRCLKHSSPSEAEEGSRNSRRNSQRALKIIEENSLILHRILQCQSRLTPSPPLLENNAPALSRDTSPSLLINIEEGTAETGKPCSAGHDEVAFESIVPPDTGLSRQYLHEDLTERPAACDDISQRTNFSTEYLTHEFDRNLKLSNTDGSISKVIARDPEESAPQPGSKYSSILEYSKSLDERYKALILNSPVRTVKSSDSSGSGFASSTASTGSDSKKRSEEDQSAAFNPFPVKISSRQNKDVGLRLGLYKK